MNFSVNEAPRATPRITRVDPAKMQVGTHDFSIYGTDLDQVFCKIEDATSILIVNDNCKESIPYS